MIKPICLFLAFFFCIGTWSQQGYLVLKKKQKSVQYFWKDSHITFQTRDGQWIAGIITKISRDSFYFTKEVIRYYMMGTDTLHFSGFRFSLADVYALPTKREQIVYDNDHVRVKLGHEKFVWVRNGFIFQALGGGYTALNVINHATQGEKLFTKKNLPGLGMGMVAFFIGTLLHHKFDRYIHPGNKYRFEYVSLDTPKGY